MFAFNYDLRLILVRPNPMRIGIGMILLLAASAELPAADWVRVTHRARASSWKWTRRAFVQGASTLKHNFGLIINLPSKIQRRERYLSAIVTLLFDCSHKKYAPFRRLEFSGHQAGGVTTGSIVRPDKEIRFVARILRARTRMRCSRSARLPARS